MNNLTNEYETYDECECEQSEFFIPAKWIVFLQFVLTSEILIVNSFFVVVFLREKKRTPTTILLSALGVTDSLTALMLTIRILSGVVLHFGEIVNNDNQSLGWLWMETYNECTTFVPISDLAIYFHLMSVELTVTLNIQRVVVLKFPIWSKHNVGKKSSIIVTGIIFIGTLPFYIHKTVMNYYSFIEGKNGECCWNDFLEEGTLDWVETSINLFMYISVAVIIICNAYICRKLRQIGRGDFIHQGKEANTQRIHSAVITVLLSIIFITSELLNILNSLNSSRLLPFFDDRLQGVFDSFFSLSWSFGFSLNFLVYSSMSKQLRETIIRTACAVCRRRKHFQKHSVQSGKPRVATVGSSMTSSESRIKGCYIKSI